MNDIGIYKITNLSGKVYIGQTWQFKKRMWYYRKGHCKGQIGMHRSLLKYGVVNHSFELIHQLPKDCSQKVMDDYEQLYMDLYRNAGVLLLNMKEAGSKGKPSIETRERMSIAASNKIVSKETVELLRFLTNNKSESTRKKISEAQMGNKHRLGIPHKEAVLKKMSQASKKFVYQITTPSKQIDTTDNLGEYSKARNLTAQLLGLTFRGYYANGDICNHHKGYKIISKEKIIK